jgi:hypothetical protein
VSSPLFPWMERHNASGVVDVPQAIAGAGGDRSPHGSLQDVSVERGINAGLGDGARSTQRVTQGRRSLALTSVARAARWPPPQPDERDDGTGGDEGFGHQSRCLRDRNAMVKTW